MTRRSPRDGSPSASGTLKNRVWEVLEPPAPGDRLSRLFDFLLVSFVLVSVTGVTLRTVPSLMAEHASLLWAIEVFTVAVFTLELALRVWCADFTYRGFDVRPRMAYLRSTEGVFDVLAMAPFYVGMWATGAGPVVETLALLRILKLVRYSPALATLSTVIVQERQALLGAVTTMLVLLLFSSTVIYMVERGEQPEAFGSIPASMWWGIATLTTVGYGDVTPITPVGKLFGAIVTLLGIGMFALPAGILSSGFTKEMKQRRFLRTAGLVGSVPLFEGLTAPEIAEISRRLEPLVVQAGQVVVRKDDPATSMFFVADGELAVEVDGAEKRLHSEFFGEIALLHGGTRSATIRTLTRCQLLVLHARHFEELLATSKHIERSVTAVAQSRLEQDEQRTGL